MRKVFGTEFSPKMAVSHFDGNVWSIPEIQDVAPLEIHPSAHVLHYSSEIFEGLKAYSRPDGSAQIFRLDKHVSRMKRSAELLFLPFPGKEVVTRVVCDLVAENRESIPPPPDGALYIRPALIGMDPNIGAAGTASETAMFFVLNSPVGAYFTGEKPLRIVIEEKGMRSVPGYGSAKTGGNYAAALGHVLRARDEHQADQVLFCPGGDVQETGASNFMLLDDETLVTKPLDDNAVLHGVTRDSVLTLADNFGYKIEERDFHADEILAWIAGGGEAALSGTAAVLAGVGTFIRGGTEYYAGGEGGLVGPNTKRLRDALTAIQNGTAEDKFGWLTKV
ncbi:MAG: branched-chain-amino-acid transaminase [Verrucomicrobiales bacterium]|nr:branched-chain-amino-acid transaminase [Verrucomicrobiales bacterium]